MLIGSLNAIFAVAAFFLSRRSLMHGIPFIQTGWMAIQSQAGHPDVRENVFRRMTATEGGRFFLGGVGWILVGILALLAGIYFSIAAYQSLYSGAITT